MVAITLNGRAVEAPEGTTVLEAATAAGVQIPTLCYLKDLNCIGSCRVCLVDVEGEGLAASCNTAVREGMVVRTDTPQVAVARRANLQAIMDDHRALCATCVRQDTCALRDLASTFNLADAPGPLPEPAPWDADFPLQRDSSKCIKCMRCVAICEKVQHCAVWDFTGVGPSTKIIVRDNLPIAEAGCALCGQCITHCPVGALRERDDTRQVFAALADPEKITVVQVAPAVRTAWGEFMGLSPEQATVKRMVAALRRIGFDYIFDTNFAADLTIMEEGSEFLQRLKNPGAFKAPMFTSCCPGWVRFLKSQYPDMVSQLSTAKSPQQMFGAVAKSYYAQLLGVDPERIYSVSIMPCLAKKQEAALPTMESAGAGPDVDVVLTTRELSRMIRAEHIIPSELKEEEFDEPLGVASGAGIIFGATGGVMEAALRSAYYLVTGKNPSPDAFRDVRGMDGWKEATFHIADTPIRVAVVSGLGNARRLIQALRRGEVQYDFVEVMACPGGCSGGGGQPIHDGQELAESRSEKLYGLDAIADLRFSHENPSVQRLYKDFLVRPLSEKAHHLLHTDHTAWEMPLSPDNQKN